MWPALFAADSPFRWPPRLLIRAMGYLYLHALAADILGIYVAFRDALLVIRMAGILQISSERPYSSWRERILSR